MRSLLILVASCTPSVHAQIAYIAVATQGATVMRFLPSGAVQYLPPGPAAIIAMTTVPAGASAAGCTRVLAVQSGGGAPGSPVWCLANPFSGGLVFGDPIGSVPQGIAHGDILFAMGSLYAIGAGTLTQLDTTNFSQVGSPVNLNLGSSPDTGGAAFDGAGNWYMLRDFGNHLFYTPHPPSAQTIQQLSPQSGISQPFSNCDLEWAGGRLWAALLSSTAGIHTLHVGELSTAPGSGAFTPCWTANLSGGSQVVGLAVTAVPCYPNCDHSLAPPVLNIQDFTCFLNAFANSSSYANCDSSTAPPVLNVQDFTCFLNTFAAGCD